jgi:anti-sigma factor ChrR (cupin superfamily)
VRPAMERPSHVFPHNRRAFRDTEHQRHRCAELLMNSLDTPTAGGVTEPLQLNADRSLRCVVNSHTLPWQASPLPQVERRLLERDGGEVARATSVVRYAPGARFSEHLHALGEEILVLNGTLSDEAGDYGPGTYLKNPPRDTERVVVNTRTAAWRQGLVPGLRVLPLSEFETQHTALVRWAPDTYFNPHRHFGGEEIFVVEGVFSDEHGNYPAGSWLRSPHLSQHQPFSREGCLILVKTGHLLAG